MKQSTRLVRMLIILFLFGLLPCAAFAVGVPMEEQLVNDAKETLASGSVTPLLKWISDGQEPELLEAFATAQANRSSGEYARDSADKDFIETTVKLFRQREIAEFHGLQAAESSPGTIVAEADKALNTGDLASLVKIIKADVERGVTESFTKVSLAIRHKDESVEAGRVFVDAYIHYVHFVQDLYLNSGTALKQEQAPKKQK